MSGYPQGIVKINMYSTGKVEGYLRTWNPEVDRITDLERWNLIVAARDYLDEALFKQADRWYRRERVLRFARILEGKE